MALQPLFIRGWKQLSAYVLYCCPIYYFRFLFKKDEDKTRNNNGGDMCWVCSYNDYI